MRLVFTLLLITSLTPCLASYDEITVPYAYGYGMESYTDDPWTAHVDVTAECTVYWTVHSDLKNPGANGVFLGIPVRTYKPYPEQTQAPVIPVLYIRPSMGHLKAYYHGAGSGTAQLEPHLTTAAAQNPPPYANTGIISSTWGEDNFGYSWFKQGDYSDLLDHSSTITIADKGCFLCCCCNSVNAIAYELGRSERVSPPEMNTWLKNNHGYSGRNVIATKVVDFAKQVMGFKIGFKQNVPLDEAIARNLKVHCSVKGSNHWVSVPCLWLDSPGAAIRHKILDPMYGPDKRHFTRLEEYSGYSTNNTRCFYPKEPNLYQTYWAYYDTPGPLWGQSSITACSDGRETLSISSGGEELAVSTPESLEDDETEEIEELPSLTDVGDCAAGSYSVKVSGQPNAPFSVTILEYDDECNAHETTWTGTLNENGEATTTFEHTAAATYYDVGPIADLPIGTSVTYPHGVVTALLPDGFYVQPAQALTPAVFVQTSVTPAPGDRITLISGSIGERSGEKCIIATDVQYDPQTNQQKAPVGMTARKANTAWHLLSKVWGQVTAATTSDITLDEAISILCDGTQYTVGSTVSAVGVEEDEVFYVTSPTDICVLYVPGGGQQSLSRTSQTRVRQASVSAYTPRVLPAEDSIDRALNQPTGTVVSLHGVEVKSISTDSFTIGYSYAGSQSRITVLGRWDFRPCQTLDVYGRICASTDGTPVIGDVSVWAYVDSRGAIIPFPLPVRDPRRDVLLDWPWKQQVWQSAWN